MHAPPHTPASAGSELTEATLALWPQRWLPSLLGLAIVLTAIGNPLGMLFAPFGVLIVLRYLPTRTLRLGGDDVQVWQAFPGCAATCIGRCRRDEVVRVHDDEIIVKRGSRIQVGCGARAAALLGVAHEVSQD